MPAIEPARLKMQTEVLMEVFHQPDLFSHTTNELLSLYANRTQRPGQLETGRTLLPTYNTPQPVIQTILNAARQHAEKKPGEAIACSIALWNIAMLESRLLAAQLLGIASLNPAFNSQALSVLDNWCQQTDDDAFRKRMIQEIVHRLGVQAPHLILDHVKEIIVRSGGTYMKSALEMLTALVNTPTFNNLPAIFTIAGQAVRNPDPRCTPQTLDLIKAIVHRSPQEGAFFLLQAIQAGPNPDTHWLVRQVLPELPSNLAREIRNQGKAIEQDRSSKL